MKIKHLLLLLLTLVGISAKAQDWTWVGETPTNGGDFYIYHPETQKFLNHKNRTGNNLDVAASVDDAFVWNVNVNSNNDGIYTVNLSSNGFYFNLSKSGNSANPNLSTNVETIQISKSSTNTSINAYKIHRTASPARYLNYNGSNFTGAQSQGTQNDWLFISKAQVAEYYRTHPNLDMTSAIKNPSFETGNLDGWTNDGFVIHENAGKFEGDYIAEMWSAELVSGSIKQTLKSLPAGKYTLKAKVAAGFDGKQYIYAGNNKTYIEGKDGDPAQDVSVDFEVIGTSDVEIGFVRDNCRWWTGVDDWTLTLVAPRVKADMTVNPTVKYGTFCAPFAVEIPAGVTAYTVDEVEGNTLVMNEVTTISANTPVILNAEGGLAATSFYGLAEAGVPAAGLLTGVYTATLAPVGSYVLQNNGGKFGFYKVAEDQQPTVGANRAYLTVSAAAPAFFFDTETAIEAVEALTQGEAAIYDINGVKQQSLQKGINIVKMANGKTQKILVK